MLWRLRSVPPPMALAAESESLDLVPRPRKPRARASLEAAPPCTECGKRFASWKALFGHMRCHPERQWRGINRLRRLQPTHFTDEERQVAASLLLLANGSCGAGPSPSSGFTSVEPVWGNRARKHMGSGKLKRVSEEIKIETVGDCCGRLRCGWEMCCGERYRCRFSSSPPPPRSFLLDLNLPPPVEGGEDGHALVLDLELG